jgi:hypothetical protein
MGLDGLAEAVLGTDHPGLFAPPPSHDAIVTS